MFEGLRRTDKKISNLYERKEKNEKYESKFAKPEDTHEKHDALKNVSSSWTNDLFDDEEKYEMFIISTSFFSR